MLKDALSRMADVFSPSVLMQGQDYQQRGYVLNIRLSDGLLKARVKGRMGPIYDVHIDLKSWPQQPARCSCQFNNNCKHAVASLFAMQAREQLAVPSPSIDKPAQSLNDWVDALRARDDVYAKPDRSHAIAYILEPLHGGHEDRVFVRLAMAKCLKRKGLGKKVPFNTLTESRRQFFMDNDEEILASLFMKSGVKGWFDRLAIRNSELLESILKTQRAYLFNDDMVRITLGRPVDALLDWQVKSDGKQHLQLKMNDRHLQPLLLDKPWYQDKVNQVMGTMNLPCQTNQLKQILAISPVALDDVQAVTQQLAEINPDISAPKNYIHREIRRFKPRPIVRFDAIVAESVTISSIVGDDDKDNPALFTIESTFDYEGNEIKADDPAQVIFYESDQSLISIERDFEFEKNKLVELSQILSLRSTTVNERLTFNLGLYDKQVLAHYHQEKDLTRLYNQVIPLLKSKHWLVEFMHPIYEELLAEDDIEWYSEFNEQGNDFFSYQLGILVDGKPVNIVPLVAELIGKLDRDSLEKLPDTQSVKLSLANGKALRLTMGRIKPLVHFLIQYGARNISDEQTLRINRYQLILMQESEQALAATAIRWRGGEQIRQHLQQLRNLSMLDHVELPIGLNAVLRDYQHQGLNWLQFLRESRLGGVLADDMGLGKTVQTLAHMQLEKEQGRLKKASLIVAPTSLVVNWFDEATRFTPALKVLIFHGQERHGDSFDDYDLVISTYGLIQRDKSRFIEYPFYYLILDEAQSIKNARAKTTQIIQQINASHRLCLSGTPLENHLGELWSLFHFLMPGLLGDAKQFRRYFKTPIEKNGDFQRRALLAGRVRPFMLRRDKNEVASELPEKTEMVRTVELIGNQRDLYETIRMSMEKKVREAIARQGMGKSHIVLLDALLKLRQVCCDPRLVSIPGAAIAHGSSAKLDALMDLLENLVAEGRRVLIFSQFTSMLAIIEEHLKQRAYPYLKLTGQTKNRQQLVNEFQEGKTPVFLISLKAGGTGLNLTRADTVIHYDPWWNPAAEDQATDRSHRIGQVNPVFVYKLITKGTVEEAILAMQSKKRALFEGILADNAASMAPLTDSDLEQLFMPLVES